MTSTKRRTFIIQICAGAGALAAASAKAAGAAAPVLTESDPQAVALGYRADSTKVDKAKYPQHQPAQMCGQCNFFQGKPTDAMAPCQIFAGKQVSSKGWCSAFVKKA
ncbi:MAG: high-potential iron-sulfur protein [Pseudomonadota bacterium]|nr:high-potential iron-sulfur protein [Pseudomonadota bacterium]